MVSSVNAIVIIIDYYRNDILPSVSPQASYLRAFLFGAARFLRPPEPKQTQQRTPSAYARASRLRPWRKRAEFVSEKPGESRCFWNRSIGDLPWNSREPGCADLGTSDPDQFEISIKHLKDYTDFQLQHRKDNDYGGTYSFCRPQDQNIRRQYSSAVLRSLLDAQNGTIPKPCTQMDFLGLQRLLLMPTAVRLKAPGPAPPNQSSRRVHAPVVSAGQYRRGTGNVSGSAATHSRSAHPVFFPKKLKRFSKNSIMRLPLPTPLPKRSPVALGVVRGDAPRPIASLTCAQPH
jgi:hypothetical protein